MSRWAAGLDGVAVARGGWNFFIPARDARFSEEMREKLIDTALAAIDGTLTRRIRRSRHAETWLERLDESRAGDAYFKVLDPLRGLNRLRSIFKRKRVSRVASISERLVDDGIGVPAILLLGAEARGGREIIVTARIDGFNLVRHLKRANLASRRAVLRALGAEVAALHRAGYIHGDLTPFNVFVAGASPPQFVFIDHERTRHTVLSRFLRPRLRNLVQLAHLDLAGVTDTDRMRVWCGYSAALPERSRRGARRRVAAMLRARIAHDRKVAVAGRIPASYKPRQEASGS
jgi:hypothetical protein